MPNHDPNDAQPRRPQPGTSSIASRVKKQRAQDARAEFDAVMTSGDCVPSPESTYTAMPRDARVEQHAEVIERLNTINASIQQMNASLQQLISLLSQDK